MQHHSFAQGLRSKTILFKPATFWLPAQMFNY